MARIRNAMMPEKGESRDDFMDRCTSGGSSEQACEMAWEQSGTDDGTEVLIYDAIGGDFFGEGVTARYLQDQIRAVRSKSFTLRINSPGGDVFEAVAMMAILDEFKGKVHVKIDGLAASAASFLAMAGDTISMATGSMLMIHNPHAMVIGEAADMRHTADLLDKVKEQILDTYQRRPGTNRKQLSAWMDAETWMTAEEAVKAGLADRISATRSAAPPSNLAAIANRLHYRHTPKKLTESAWQETHRRAAIAASL